MKVAAYQAPLADCYASHAIESIAGQVRECERLGVELLCCPEAAVGGLADYHDAPEQIALGIHALDAAFAPLASTSVTTIVGFTELDASERLYNAAAVVRSGRVDGVYRKRHPAIRSSRYHAGSETRVFTVGALTFGIMICRDSLDDSLAKEMIDLGARALVIPSNNAMPPSRGGANLVAITRALDVERSRSLGIAVLRADVAGSIHGLVSHASTAIVDRGRVLSTASECDPQLIVAEIDAGA